jgi:N utilization substance protein A
VIAHLLVTEGFSSVEEVAFVPLEDLTDIEGFDEDVAAELQARARNHLATREEEMDVERKELGVADEIAELEGVTASLMVALGEKGIKTRDDLADLAGDELLEIAPSGSMNMDQANELIMAARAHWFEDDAPAEEAVAEAPAEPAE